MRDVSIDELPLLGAAQLERTSRGVVPHRLSERARSQTFDPAVSFMEGMPAGVRLSMHTDATSLEVDVDLTMLAVDGNVVPAAFDLTIDGELHQSISTTQGTHYVVSSKTGDVSVVPGPTATVRFDALPADIARQVEVWLPHAANVCIRGLRLSDGAKLHPAEPSARHWVHHGSSISHCLEAEGPTRTWPVAVALRTGLELQNLSFGGQCLLDPYVARMIRDARADLISLKVGINIINTDGFRERTFVPALHGFLDTVREGHPHTPLLVVTPILCPALENAPGPSVLGPDGRYGTTSRPVELSLGALTLGRVRELVALVTRTRQAAGDSNLHLLDGTELFGEADVDDLYDDLHPNAAGYARMADRFHKAVFESALIPALV